VPRVLIVEPLPVVREGYASILTGRVGFAVALAPTLEDAEERLARMDVDVVILNARQPRTTWRAACARVRAAGPRASILLVLPTMDDRVVADRHTVGIRGVILETSSPMQIRRAVRTLHEGRTFFEPPAHAARVAATPGSAVAPGFGLTRQQARVLALLPRGLSNKDIGLELGISEHTVKSHLAQIMRKLQARDRAHATSIALREGLV
jgi:two-component system, NarL family, response regulator